MPSCFRYVLCRTSQDNDPYGSNYRVSDCLGCSAKQTWDFIPLRGILCRFVCSGRSNSTSMDMLGCDKTTPDSYSSPHISMRAARSFHDTSAISPETCQRWEIRVRCDVLLRVRMYCSLVGRLHYQDRRSCFPLSGISRPVVKYASTCGLGSGRACSTASPTAFCAINPKSRGVHVRSQHGETWFVGLEETPEGGEDVLLEGTRVLWLARSGTLQDPPVWPTVADGADVHRPCHYLSQSCAFHYRVSATAAVRGPLPCFERGMASGVCWQCLSGLFSSCAGLHCLMT